MPAEILKEKPYRTLKAESCDEFVEKRSRFIGYARPVKTEEEALEFIKQMKARHWDATHNVYAYSLRQGQIRRFSDDGEPQGTAGIPVLEVLTKRQITDAVVVRNRRAGFLNRVQNRGMVCLEAVRIGHSGDKNKIQIGPLGVTVGHMGGHNSIRQRMADLPHFPVYLCHIGPVDRTFQGIGHNAEVQQGIPQIGIVKTPLLPALRHKRGQAHGLILTCDSADIFCHIL